MEQNQIDIAGLKIPFVSPFFVGMVGIHILFALVCLVGGIVAILAKKRAGQHSNFGKLYYWTLIPAVATAILIGIMRWKEDYNLIIFGCISIFAAIIGRQSIRMKLENRIRNHIIGMGFSFIFLLTAFYVDNGKNLPIWRNVPHFLYWLLPNAIGLPIIIFALNKYSRNTKLKTISENKT